ncbi:ABC transporter substrate-binding protein [Ruegeria sp. 2205SS24-7]|uniref:ABC transporter substrate-binding protein n=1 Tax=Ruegeria discodermiae TaxID=3064389 RepID=UPI002741369C|nr:ABC transporter substrate-binding protein [Ruegeria sp. 2205SS24-7]MDP5220387.1 ABC transporter substrate-binding protein [Ruegeria sp. 2205SS24-7]
MGLKSTLSKAALIAALATQAWADKEDDTLVVAFNKEVQTLDGLYSTSRENILLTYLTSDQLVTLDPETQEYHPALAESYSHIDDQTIEFVLREGVTFHNGSPVTPEDIAFSFEWVASDASKTKRGAFVRSWFDSVEVIDNRTIRVKSKKPYPLMLRDIAMFVQTRQSGSYGALDAPNIDAQTQSLNGTGPYEIVEFDKGGGLTLKKFDGYYGDSPKVTDGAETIVIRPIPEWGTVSAEMISGGVHFAYTVPDDTAQNLGTLPMIEHIVGPTTRIGFLILDAGGVTDENGPMTNQKVRQAMNHAVNRQAIVDHLVGGKSVVIDSLCYEGMFGCSQDVTSYEYDPEQAKALLAEAGYPDGFEFDLWAYRDKPITEAVAADLAKVGIKANINFVKLSALSKARAAEEAPAMHGTWGYYATQDIGAISNHFVAGSNRNLNRDPELEDLFKAGLETIDPQERTDLYGKALRLAADQAYHVPIYRFSENYVANQDVNFEAPADGLVRLNEITWK